MGCVRSTKEASVDRINIIGIDISKRSFQLHGATAEGKPVFGKKLSREKFLVFLSEAPPCLVVMEACGGAHYWGRQIIALGHTCKLMSGRALARAPVGGGFPAPPFRLRGGFTVPPLATFPAAPPKIPDIGFSPVRLQASGTSQFGVEPSADASGLRPTRPFS